MVDLRLCETSIDMFTFWTARLQLQKSQAARESTGGSHTTQQRRNFFTLNLMPDAESAAVFFFFFSALEQLRPDVCFHHTFTF